MGSTSWTSREFRTPDYRFDLVGILDLAMAQSEQPRSSPEVVDLEMGWKQRLTTRRDGDLTGIRQAMTMPALAELLEAATGRPVVDETGLAGAYELDVETEERTTADFIEALGRTHGLVLTPGRRDVSVLVVRKSN